MFWSQVISIQMQPSPVNKWYNATQNWRTNKSTTLIADQIHTYDCNQYCIIECLKILIIYDDTPLKVWCETKYRYTTKPNKINRNKVPKAIYLTYTELFVCLPQQMLSTPEQFVSLLEQLASAPEQLRKSSGAVSKCYGAIKKVFRSSYKSSGTLISVPEQLISVTDQLRKCSGAVNKCYGPVTKVFRSS